MKMWKEKHLMNNKGETKGYDITIKIGNKEYKSWWTSPPQESYRFDKEYLKGRYCIITTDKRAKEFSRLWSEMWDKEDKPKARKIIEDFIKEYEYTYKVEDILEEYPTWGKTYKSYTMTICIKNLEPQIKTLLDLWEE